MIFAEAQSGWLMIVHAIVGAALVASATHLVVYMRDYPRGRFKRPRAVRRFALIVLALYGAAFLLGNVIYPAYKVRVKVEYLEEGGAVVEAAAQQARTRARIAERNDVAVRAPTDAELATESALLPREMKKVARWFDVKEHWAAIGLALAIAVAVLLLAWRPERHPPDLGWVAFALATLLAAATWLSLIIGLYTTSHRSL